jgi:mannose-6-phosphate isomerase-like protein (cupin superfamily)
VPRPSTGGNRWLVVCLEGYIVVQRSDSPPFGLAVWEMTHIPAGVEYDIRNESGREASFLLVYAQRIEEKNHETHDH